MVTVYYGICYRDVCHEFHWFLDCVGISWPKTFLDKSSPARSQIVVIYFTLLKVSQIIINADANASKVLFNIVNFWNCTKSWMHWRAYKIYKKRKKKIKIVLGNFGWSLFSVKLFIQHFQIHLTRFSSWMHLSTVLSNIWFSLLRWTQNISSGVCFKRLYWHSNINICGVPQKFKRREKKQKWRVRKKRIQMLKKTGPAMRSLLIDMLEANLCLWDVYHTNYTNCCIKEVPYTEISTSLDTNISSIKTKINDLRLQLGREMAKEKTTGALTSNSLATGYTTRSLISFF